MMYLEHFGLQEQPFGMTPDPKFLYFTAGHAEALAALHYGLTERRGLLVLTAAPGMGKTTLLHYLVERWKEKAQIAFIIRPPETRDQMMAAVLEDLGLGRAGDYEDGRRKLHDLAIECHRQGRRLLLVFDEAQAIPAAVLEEIRLLSNFETPQAKLIEIILAGQPELSEQLDAPECEPLNQRVSVRAQIGPLHTDEARRYIEHRLRVAGPSGKQDSRLFARRALDLAAQASQGIPRKLNAICFEALGSAFGAGRRRVREREIRSAAPAAGLALPQRGPRPAAVPRVAWAAGLAAMALSAGAVRFDGGAAAIERALLRLNWIPKAVSAAAPQRPAQAAPVVDTAPALARPGASEEAGDALLPPDARAEEEMDIASGEAGEGNNAEMRTGHRSTPLSANVTLERVHVQFGQTLRSICLRVYGHWNPMIWERIRLANPSLSSPDMLRAGQVLLLPGAEREGDTGP